MTHQDLKQEIQKWLDQLAETNTVLNNLTTVRETELNDLITPEIRAKQEEIHAKFDAQLTELSKLAEKLTAQIKTATEVHGEGVAGSSLQVTYSAPRALWNTDMLEGLALSIPAVLGAKHMSKPTITIKPVKAK